MDAKEFYGESYNRAKDTAKLDDAVKRLDTALQNEASNNGTMTKVGEMSFTLACKKENEAFA
jgi:hypothetical protein